MGLRHFSCFVETLSNLVARVVGIPFEPDFDGYLIFENSVARFEYNAVVC
jgi:hypothetical protein